MSRRANSPRLDLKLNLSPSRDNQRVESPKTSNSSWEMSPESSCVSSESEETIPMVIVGCPRCLMYVMLSEVDPKCPKCKSTVLLNVLNEENTKKTPN